MRSGTLNLGILAHVDAGKTTLTERLLHAAGVIDEIGSVDAGTTQTDFLALERQRGITIRSAVVSFPLDGVSVNLIDTPGHPDFIAEVERVLSILDGAILVLSAVEGVQPQTRVLMRALQRLRVPTLLFVNKIDRGGAAPDRVVEAIAGRLTPAIVPMGSVVQPGTRAARFEPFTTLGGTKLVELLATHDDALLAAFVADESTVTAARLRRALAAQVKRALVHPVFFGSAATGAGVESLMAGLAELLPSDVGDPEAPAAGRIFKIERGTAGEKIAYVRLFAGTLRTREKIRDTEKVTAISVFDRGAWVRRSEVTAGQIGKLWGLGSAQVGDAIGVAGAGTAPQCSQPGALFQFPPPTLETVVAPVHPRDRNALRVALGQLAEQDPLINVQQDDARQEISVSLYGEVQKEVIQATLANDYGVDVRFHETTIIYVERPVGVGEAIEHLNADGNPFHATMGLRVEPAPPDSGIEFRLAVEPKFVPMYAYHSVDGFAAFVAEYVRDTLTEGLYGWRVIDCLVTLYACNYSSADGPPSTRGPLSTPADYRRLTPMVLMRALREAGTAVCEPVVRATLELPTPAVGAVLAALGRLGAAVTAPAPRGELATLEAVLPVARVPELQHRLPGLTGGEGVLETTFAGYAATSGERPTRRRTTANPLNREEYLMLLSRQGAR